MATKKPFRKSQLIAFENAAAGHDGVLSDPAGELIVKPCKQSEINFYESASAHPTILPFIPTYMGRLALGSNTGQAPGALILPGDTASDEMSMQATTTATLPVVEHAWAPSGGGKIQTNLAIVMENVAAGFYKPNILDVKLGARLWADDAPMEKRARLDKAAEETTSKPLGFRIAGMKVYQCNDLDPASFTEPYKVFDKNYGRSFSADTIVQGFEDFFMLEHGNKASGSKRKVIGRFVADLEELVRAVSQEECRIYSASLLFVYEGNSASLRDAFQREPGIIAAIQRQDSGSEHLTVSASDDAGDDASVDGSEDLQTKLPPIQSLKLIDFAHATWTPGLGKDENMLFGIDNVIKSLRQLLSHT